jgi:hypothetical protein
MGNMSEDRLDLHAVLKTAIERFDEADRRIQERHEALAQTVELLSRDIADLKIAAQQDGENIRALARIAEIHERRLSHLEGPGDRP